MSDVLCYKYQLGCDGRSIMRSMRSVVDTQHLIVCSAVSQVHESRWASDAWLSSYGQSNFLTFARKMGNAHAFPLIKTIRANFVDCIV